MASEWQSWDWRKIQAVLIGDVSADGYTHINQTPGVTNPAPVYQLSTDLAQVRTAVETALTTVKKQQGQLIQNKAWTGDAATAFDQVAGSLRTTLDSHSRALGRTGTNNWVNQVHEAGAALKTAVQALVALNYQGAVLTRDRYVQQYNAWVSAAQGAEGAIPDQPHQPWFVNSNGEVIYTPSSYPDIDQQMTTQARLIMGTLATAYHSIDQALKSLTVATTLAAATPNVPPPTGDGGPPGGGDVGNIPPLTNNNEPPPGGGDVPPLTGNGGPPPGGNVLPGVNPPPPGTVPDVGNTRAATVPGLGDAGGLPGSGGAGAVPGIGGGGAVPGIGDAGGLPGGGGGVRTGIGGGAVPGIGDAGGLPGIGGGGAVPGIGDAGGLPGGSGGVPAGLGGAGVPGIGNAGGLPGGGGGVRTGIGGAGGLPGAGSGGVLPGLGGAGGLPVLPLGNAGGLGSAGLGSAGGGAGTSRPTVASAPPVRYEFPAAAAARNGGLGGLGGGGLGGLAGSGGLGGGGGAARGGLISEALHAPLGGTQAGTGGSGAPYMPMGGGAGAGAGGGGGKKKERERTTWLQEDRNIWAVGGDVTSGVIRGGDPTLAEEYLGDEVEVPVYTPGARRPGQPTTTQHNQTGR